MLNIFRPCHEIRCPRLVTYMLQIPPPPNKIGKQTQHQGTLQLGQKTQELSNSLPGTLQLDKGYTFQKENSLSLAIRNEPDNWPLVINRDGKSESESAGASSFLLKVESES